MFLEQILLIFFFNHSLLITISFGLEAEVEIKHTRNPVTAYYHCVLYISSSITSCLSRVLNVVLLLNHQIAFHLNRFLTVKRWKCKGDTNV